MQFAGVYPCPADLLVETGVICSDCVFDRVCMESTMDIFMITCMYERMHKVTCILMHPLSVTGHYKEECV